MLTDIAGIEVGQWTDSNARTGVTVVILPPDTTASGEVRGGAPATREFALLDPVNTVSTIDAVVLSGGSAFGLAAADGVMTWLEEQDRGFETKHGRVPIVIGLSLFDLGVGDATVRPGPDQGRAAAAAAAPGHFATGQVGAGTGATVSKWSGPDGVQPGGLVSASMQAGDLIVASLVAVNAVGAIDDGTTTGDLGPPARATSDVGNDPDTDGGDRTNTTIGLVATNAKLDKAGCQLMARSAHNGLARAVLPAHTSGDGDAFVAAATGTVEADASHVRLLAQQVVTVAIRSLASKSKAD